MLGTELGTELGMELATELGSLCGLLIAPGQANGGGKGDKLGDKAESSLSITCQRRIWFIYLASWKSRTKWMGGEVRASVDVLGCLGPPGHDTSNREGKAEGSENLHAAFLPGPIQQGSWPPSSFDKKKPMVS